MLRNQEKLCRKKKLIDFVLYHISGRGHRNIQKRCIINQLRCPYNQVTSMRQCKKLEGYRDVGGWVSFNVAPDNWLPLVVQRGLTLLAGWGARLWVRESEREPGGTEVENRLQRARSVLLWRHMCGRDELEGQTHLKVNKSYFDLWADILHSHCLLLYYTSNDWQRKTESRLRQLRLLWLLIQRMLSECSLLYNAALRCGNSIWKGDMACK